MIMFNKPCDWTLEDWFNSDARQLLDQLSENIAEWVYLDYMTDEEKSKNPTCETVDGYLKRLDKSEYAQAWWDSLDDAGKQIIYDLPNFDAEIFKECTGITA